MICDLGYFRFLLLAFTLFVLSFATKNETYIDTINHGSEVSLITEKVSKVSVLTINEDNLPTKDSLSMISSVTYRIQISASSLIETIRVVKKEAEDNLKLNGYISFDEPYYKLMVGNFPNKATAQKNLVNIRSNGYPDAWIVSVKQKY